MLDSTSFNSSQYNEGELKEQERELELVMTAYNNLKNDDGESLMNLASSITGQPIGPGQPQEDNSGQEDDQ